LKAFRLAAVAAAICLTALGVATAEASFFVAALPLAAWSALGFFRSAPDLRLEAERWVSDSFPDAGTTVEILVSVRNRGARIERLSLRDSLPAGVHLSSGRTEWAGSLDPDASARLGYAVSVDRGVHRFESLRALADEPFTALAAEATLPCPAKIVAPPERLLCGPLALESSAVRPFAGESRARRQGGGSDFAGTREYAPGDPLRSLNWRAEALWGESIVNIFEEDRALDVGIILDARAEAYDRAELFEAAVAAAAALADRLLEGGNRVAFLSYGAAVEWTPPGAGRAQRTAIRIAAARASFGDHAAFERFDNLPVRLFPPRSSVLLVSPLLRGDLVALLSIRALGYSVTVLRPDPLSAPGGRGESSGSDAARSGAGRLARRLMDLEAKTLEGRLRRARIEVIDWDIGKSLARSIEIAEAAR